MKIAKKLSVLLLSVLLLVGWLGFGRIQASETLTIYAHEMRPYHYMEQGHWRGINLELVKRALEAEAIPFRIKMLNWARAAKLVQSTEQTGLLTVERTSEREHLYQWVGPLVSSPTTLIGLKSRAIRVDNIEHLSTLTIGVLREGATHQYLRQQGLADGVQLVPLVSVTDTYQMLKKGRVDLIPASAVTLALNAKRAGVNPELLNPLYTLPIKNGQNYLALSPTAPADWVHSLNERLKQLRQQGVFEQVTQHYLAPVALSQ
ncbi:hypothetical protein HMF8227_02637 [Saliniradius amylolyticus]|uniref:Solute-binding protein family 3/N-terminal domain-containing protein n=1 Tax=Saliniradius amylolyticus TaxID=2183582 RepID=A0A2S2E661_9ALTE|nr:transporter substrate-binding domain-containing protein [Saliniradius amylolyticus]AWL13089.1 hypothetical protein HMF8227_02637 [Saliniradius amylolyticus]